MRIGFFGGSFDPPHNGHLAVARAAADTFGLDRVLLAPVGFQPLKPQGSFASYSDRLAMVTLLVDGDSRLEASALDVPREDRRPNYTIDTLVRLKEEGTPEDELFVIVGIDAFAGLRRWHEPGRLLDLADWITVSRPGYTLQSVIAQVAPESRRSHVHALDSVQIPLSSTELRERLATNAPCGDLLPQKVLAYIRSHHLYGNQAVAPIG